LREPRDNPIETSQPDRQNDEKKTPFADIPEPSTEGPQKSAFKEQSPLRSSTKISTRDTNGGNQTFCLFEWQVPTSPVVNTRIGEPNPSNSNELIRKVDEYLLNFKEERSVRSIYGSTRPMSKGDVESLIADGFKTSDPNAPPLSNERRRAKHLFKAASDFLESFIPPANKSSLIAKFWGALHSLVQVCLLRAYHTNIGKL
jgi:hypothetical protein